VKEVTCSIYRGTQEASEERFDKFTVTVDERSTVLDCLEYIRSELDESLMYRHSCHHGSCGTCGMIINGNRSLACLTNVERLDADHVTLRPLQTMVHLGDLACDPSALFDDFPVGATYVRESEAVKEATAPEEVGSYERFEDCIECGLCVSSCPVQQSFMGPAALAAYRRESINRPERAEELQEEVNVDRGVWACERALNCSNVCPTGVYPAKHIALLQRSLSANSVAGKGDDAGSANEARNHSRNRDGAE
jgi:succinate dehydrogenase / fumarate reductase iron-sulfur subunit